jgi:hypothetical protein
MPYRLKPTANKNLFFVVDDSGREYSKSPLTRKKALAQMRALYASEGRVYR